MCLYERRQTSLCFLSSKWRCKMTRQAVDLCDTKFGNRQLPFLSVLFYSPKLKCRILLLNSNQRFATICLLCCRSASSLQRASESTSCLANCKTDDSTSENKLKDIVQTDQVQRKDLRLPFGDWFSHPWSKTLGKSERESDTRYHICRTMWHYHMHSLCSLTLVTFSFLQKGSPTKGLLKTEYRV